MPDAIKRKALKNSAFHSNKRGITLSPNQLSIPSSFQNNSPVGMINGRQTSHPELKSVFFKNKNEGGISNSFCFNYDKKSDFLKNRFLSGDRENEGEKRVLFSDLVSWVIKDPVLKKVIKKGRNSIKLLK